MRSSTLDTVGPASSCKSHELRWEEGAEPGSLSLRDNSLQLEHEAHSHSELFKTELFPNSALQVVCFIFFFWSCLVLTLEGAFIQATNY